MSKAEQFIEDYTNHCSNLIQDDLYQPWLTPEQAKRAVEIEREEIIDKACEYIRKDWWNMLVYDTKLFGGSQFNLDKTIERFRKAMEE